MLKKIFVCIAILAMTICSLSGCDFDEGAKDVYQEYDEKKAYDVTTGTENNYSTYYIITDANDNLLLKSTNGLIYIADNGYFVKIEDGRDDNGSMKYVGSTILNQGKGKIIVPDVGLFPFGKYFIGCFYLTKEIRGVYDYNGNIVLKPSDDERFIAIDDRLYIVTKDFTKILDNELNPLGQANIEVSKRMLQSMYYNIKGVDKSNNDHKEKYGLIFEKDGLSGICNMNLNVLIKAEYFNIVYHNNKYFELRDKQYKTISYVSLHENGTFEVNDETAEILK